MLRFSLPEFSYLFWSQGRVSDSVSSGSDAFYLLISQSATLRLPCASVLLDRSKAFIPQSSPRLLFLLRDQVTPPPFSCYSALV